MADYNNVKRKGMKWLKYHEVKALKVYYELKLRLESDKNFTCSMNNFLRKLLNNCYLDTGLGLKSVSKLNRTIFENYTKEQLLSLERGVERRKL